MARAVSEGRRVVLITCTRGEMGDIVVPELDTPENHRRLGEIRAAELEQAMAALGVTEWENLGYHDSDMMGRPGNRDPRTFWQANLDEAIGRLVWMVRRYRPDVMTTYNDFGGYGHPDHIRTHLVAVGAFARAGDPAWYPEQLAPEHGGTRRGGGRGGPRAVGPGQALRAGDPGLGPHGAPGADGRHRRALVLEPARGRHAGAARRVRGLRRPDARPGRDRHDLGGRVGAAGPALGCLPRPRHPDQRREPVRPLRPRRLGASSGPARRSCAARRASRPPTTRTTCSRGSRVANQGRTAGAEPGPAVRLELSPARVGVGSGPRPRSGSI